MVDLLLTSDIRHPTSSNLKFDIWNRKSEIKLFRTFTLQKHKNEKQTFNISNQ